MRSGTRIAAGIAGGYLLGRSRKGRWLLLLAAAVASKRLSGGLVQRGAETLKSSPEVGKLAEQGRSAAVAMVSQRIEALTERIHDQTESLRQGPAATTGKDQPGSRGEDDARSADRSGPDEEPEGGAGKPEEPEGRAEEPEGRAEEPEGRAEEPEGRAEEPEGRAEEPEGRAEEPEGRAEEPEGRAEEPEAPPDKGAEESGEPEPDRERRPRSPSRQRATEPRTSPPRRAATGSSRRASTTGRR